MSAKQAAELISARKLRPINERDRAALGDVVTVNLPAPRLEARLDLGRMVEAIAAAKNKRSAPRGMNKWERAYSLVLQARKLTGDIDEFEFEGLSFKLGRGARFKPDFVVWKRDDEGTIRPPEVECYEVKGHWREAARVRIKVAASKYPWCRFVAVSKDGDGWKTETFEP